MFTIDLTQVSQPSQRTLHELEIEFKDARVLLAEARKEAEGRDNQYMEMVAAFLNNISKLESCPGRRTKWLIFTFPNSFHSSGMLIRNASDP